MLIPKAEGYATMMDLPEDVAANVLKELPHLARCGRVGLHTAIKPLLIHSTTAEFNSPPKYLPRRRGR